MTGDEIRIAHRHGADVVRELLGPSRWGHWLGTVVRPEGGVQVHVTRTGLEELSTAPGAAEYLTEWDYIAHSADGYQITARYRGAEGASVIVWAQSRELPAWVQARIDAEAGALVGGAA